MFLVLALCVFTWRLITPPEYLAKATFRFAAERQDQSDMLRSFLQNPRTSLSKEGGAQMILGSKAMIRSAAEDLGLLFEEKSPFILIKWILSAKDRIFAELGCQTPDRRSIIFSHTTVQAEEKWDFWIHQTSNECFDVCDHAKKKIAEGRIGKEVTWEGRCFTVEKFLKQKKWYHVRATPWFPVWKKLHAHLKVRPSKLEKNIFLLSFSHKSRDIAGSFLDKLMFSYQKYLQKENEKMAVVQMEYLEKRKQELLDKYDHSLQEHQTFLQQGLKATGFLQLKQEVEFLEKPYEEYTRRLHEIDLKLQRLNKVVPHGQNPLYSAVSWESPSLKEGVELEGVSPEIAERLCIEYNQKRDDLRVSMETMRRLQKQIFQEDFELTSLSGILSDNISLEMIEHAGKVALQLQDTLNHSDKDVKRLQASLFNYKKFLAEHLAQQLEVQRIQSKLLQDKISSLQRTSARLLQEERQLLMQQLNSLQKGMQILPEKWKREHQLVMERDLSVGMLEGLSQLTESKNIHHHLFYVESKPIDQAYAPFKPERVFALFEAVLIGAFVAFLYLMKDFARWLSLGIFITERSAKSLGVAFSGYLPKFLHKTWQEMESKEKEVIRKISAHIGLQGSKGQGCAVAVFSSSHIHQNIADLLKKQGLNVLVIECTFPTLQYKKQAGLYDYLLSKADLIIQEKEGIDTIISGEYTEHFIELLNRQTFGNLIKEQKELYDVILLHLDAEISEAAAEPLKRCSDFLVVHAEDLLYENVEEKGKMILVLTG
jgi:hypothetical protein